MVHYEGYGFDSIEISGKGLYKFIKTAAPDDARKIFEEMEISDPGESISDLPVGQQKDIINGIEEWIESDCISTSEYIVSVINSKEACPNLLQAIDNFVVFAPVCFMEDDNGRSSIIKSRQDMQKLIAGYFPGEKFKFGSVCEGVEWAEPCYYMD